MERTEYEHPLLTRYASAEMSKIWSPCTKFETWRKLWIVLAESERELGLKEITEEALREMKEYEHQVNYDVAEKYEREFRHDVMSHVHAFGDQCPSAKKIIHLGATSCYVGDNADLIQIQLAANLVKTKLLRLLAILGKMADQYKDLPMLGYTHFQPAQLTTLGKRISLWLHDFLLDFHQVEHFLETLSLRGVKGTTGTQASFLSLFDGDDDKVKQLDQMVASKLGFSRVFPVCGQTYSRKLDYQFTTILSGIAQSAHKMCTDLRLLASMKQVEEPFGKKQIGSSAMAYKRNPMRSERVCSLARYVMSLPINAAHTHSVQWFERTLDDSANRRMLLPEACLGIDAILDICSNVIDGLQVWPLVIRKFIDDELPFMATETILMECVQAGGDRQELHEAIRLHSMEAGRQVKEYGASNDLLNRIASDSLFDTVKDRLDKIIDPKAFIGRCPAQVSDFLSLHLTPLLTKYSDQLKDLPSIQLKV